MRRAFNLIDGDLGAPNIHACLNGPVWTQKTTPVADRYNGLVKVSATKYVATGAGQAGITPINTFITNDAGATWISGGSIPNDTNSTPNSPVFGNGRICCYINSSTETAFSDNQGTSWATFTNGLIVPVDLKFGNGLFVSLGAAAQTGSSAAGTNPNLLATPAICNAILWVPSRGWWVIWESAGNRIWTSPDLITWTLRGNNPQATGGAITGRNVIANGDNLVAVFSDGTLKAIVSNDGGLTWNNSTSNVFWTSLNSLEYGNGIFLATTALAGRSTISSDGGQTWISGNLLPLAGSWIAKWDGLNTWIAVDGAGTADVGNVAQGIC